MEKCFFWPIGGLLAAIPQMVVSRWGGLNNTFMVEYPVGSQVSLPQICHLKIITIKDWHYSAVFVSSHPTVWQFSPASFRLFHVQLCLLCAFTSLCSPFTTLWFSTVRGIPTFPASLSVSFDSPILSHFRFAWVNSHLPQHPVGLLFFCSE